MGDAEYYRAQSEFCAQMADQVRGAEDKDRWLRLAEKWRELAEQADPPGQAAAS